MRLLETHRVPLITSIWMIFTPLFFAFIAGAGAGTVFDPLATFAGTVWSIFGGASLILGVVLFLWVAFTAWRGSELNG